MMRLREFAGTASVAFAAMGLAVVLQGAGALDARLPTARHRAAPQPPMPAAHIVRPVAPIAAITIPAPAPARPKVEPPQIQVAETQATETRGARPLPESARAEAALPPQVVMPDPALSGEMAEAVAMRVREKVPAGLAPYFDLYIYVSKATHGAGPWAQHMFLFNKRDDGTLSFEQSFAISTGRERQEQYFTASPVGLFELDPSRFMRMAYSGKWHGAAMPWAMFLNYSYRTKMSGVALHGAIGREISHLGHRASGGCVRMPMDKVEALFHRLKSTARGRVPVFAFDDSRGTTNVHGEMLRDAAGNPVLADGIKALVIIDRYPGHALANGPQS